MCIILRTSLPRTSGCSWINSCPALRAPTPWADISHICTRPCTGGNAFIHVTVVSFHTRTEEAIQRVKDPYGSHQVTWCASKTRRNNTINMQNNEPDLKMHDTTPDLNIYSYRWTGSSAKIISPIGTGLVYHMDVWNGLFFLRFFTDKDSRIWSATKWSCFIRCFRHMVIRSCSNHNITVPVYPKSFSVCDSGSVS